MHRGSNFKNQGFRDHPRNFLQKNSNKFEIPKNIKTANMEINEWFDKNKNNDIKLAGCVANKFTMLMTHGNATHKIEIEYPLHYPTNKKGFACKEISTANTTPLNFIKKANEQFENKTLSIERVITHLANTFDKYKKIKTEANSEIKSNVIFNDNTNIDLDDWSPITATDKAKINTEPQVSSKEETEIPTLNTTTEKVEMVRLDTDETNNDISADIDIINKILETNANADNAGKNNNAECNTNSDNIENEIKNIVNNVMKTQEIDDKIIENDTIKNTEKQESEFEKFLAKELAILEKDNPMLAEEEIMNIVQKKWDKLQKINDPDSNDESGTDDGFNDNDCQELVFDSGSDKENYDNDIEVYKKTTINTEDSENNNTGSSDAKVNTDTVIEISKLVDKNNNKQTNSNGLQDDKDDKDISMETPADQPTKIIDEPDDSQEKSPSEKSESNDDQTKIEMDKKPIAPKISSEEEMEASNSESPIMDKKKPKKYTYSSGSEHKEIKPLSPKSGKKKPAVAKVTTTTDKIMPLVDKSEINYADVDDTMGLYLDLGNYTKNTKLPFDMEKLMTNAKKLQEDMDFGNATRVKKSFNATSAIRVVINEFVKTYYNGLKNNYHVMPVADNIYHLKLTFKPEFFDKNSDIYRDIVGKREVQIEIQIDSKLYPFYPPKVRLVSPRLRNHLNSRIATMECLLLSKWSPTFSVETIINYFRKLMNQYAQIDGGLENYDDLENDLIELALLSEIPARANLSLTIKDLDDIKKESQEVGTASSKTKWVKGTGYGHGGLNDWDFKTTMKAKEERAKQLSKCVRNITSNLTRVISKNINIDAVNIIMNSCFIPYIKSVFYGNNILELLKNPAHFELLLNSMRIMTKSFSMIYLVKDGDTDKSLFEIFGDINTDCKSYLKTIEKATDKTTPEVKTEIDLVNNFVTFYSRISRDIKEINKCDNKRNNEKIVLDLQSQYKKLLESEICKEYEDMNTNSFEKLWKEAGEKETTPFINTKSLQHIAKEMLSHSKSMPLEWGSSIFYRFNPNNLKFHEFVIAGPEGTPYDSGCFLFRMYCPSNYPNVCPKVNLYTTGGGTVRFNPNLYACGKVCLSILGTWRGQAGESWIPGISTMLQVMVSIQSLVMIAEPYFNEPGYESSQGTPNGKTLSDEYNQTIRLGCMKWAMIDMIKNPPNGFENAVLTHFKLKTKHILSTCSQWVSEAPVSMKPDFENNYKKLQHELAKLNNENSNQDVSSTQSTSSESKPVNNVPKKTVKKPVKKVLKKPMAAVEV